MSSIYIGKIIITDKEIYGSREFNREMGSLGIIEYIGYEHSVARRRNWVN